MADDAGGRSGGQTRDGPRTALRLALSGTRAVDSASADGSEPRDEFVAVVRTEAR